MALPPQVGNYRRPPIRRMLAKVGCPMEHGRSQTVITKFITEFTTVPAVAPPHSEVCYSAVLGFPRASTNLPVFTIATFHSQGKRRAAGREIVSTISNALDYWSHIGKSSRTRYPSTDYIINSYTKFPLGMFPSQPGHGWIRCLRLWTLFLPLLTGITLTLKSSPAQIPPPCRKGGMIGR